jgi:hypothetical protein
MVFGLTAREQKALSTNLKKATSALVEALEQRALLSGVSFGAPVATGIGAGGFTVVSSATADLNGDGIPDLIADRGNLLAQVYLGTSTGALTPGQLFATGGSVIALGDFNGDTNLDLATPDGILPGAGNGTFGASISPGGFALPANTVNLYAQDINGDGHLDLIAATFTPASGSGQSQPPTIGLSVMLGNGDGSFQAPIATTVGAAPILTASDAIFRFADFNHDGNLDAVSPLGVMFGNGDGSFAATVALPYANPGVTSPAIPTPPLLAVGDFNGDGFPDLAVSPAVAAPGQIEIFLNNGKGVFVDDGPVNIAVGDAITSLTTDNLLAASKASDLIAGITTTSGINEIAVLRDTGLAVFAPAAFYTIDGPSVGISAGDFNADSVPDLLSVDQAAGTTGTTAAINADVLLGAPNVGITPTISMRASSNPVVSGFAVEYFANVSAPSGTSSPAPTGNVTFFDGSTSLGTVMLVSGKANITVNVVGVGTHPITVAYSGDANYSNATSSPLQMIVLATGAKQPLLIPSLGNFTLPSEFLPGDKGILPVTITNGGDQPAHGKVSVNLYLSPDGIIDANAIPLKAPSLANRNIHLGIGGVITIKANVVAGAYPAGVYYLVAQLVPVATLSAGDISQAPVVSASAYYAEGMVFGTVGKHRNIKLKVTDPAGHSATFSLKGPGLGSVVETNGAVEVSIGSTSGASKLTIAGHGSFTVDTIDVVGSLNGILARGAVVGGSLTITGGVKSVDLAGVDADAAVTIGKGASPTLSLGVVAFANLTSASKIKTLTASSWQGGVIDAPSIGNLLINGSIGADIHTHSFGKLTSAKIGSVTGGTWAIAGDIGAIKIAGALSNANLFAGADTGPDDNLGTTDDIFTAAAIGSLFVGGADTSSLVVAGGSIPPRGAGVIGPVTVDTGGALRALLVRGAVSPDAKFIANRIPSAVSLNGVRVATAGNLHFQQ